MFENIKKLLKLKDDKAMNKELAGANNLYDRTNSISNTSFLNRDPFETYFNGESTPLKIARALASANQGNIVAQSDLAEVMEEKDPVYRNAISTRKMAITSKKLVVVPAGNSQADKAAAALIEQVVKDSQFKRLVANMTDAISKGVSVTEVVWGESGGFQIPIEFIPRPQRYFVYDRSSDGSKLLLQGSGTTPEELPPFKFIIHHPELKAGIPARSGLVRPCAAAYCYKSLALHDWAGFVEMFGKPFVLGKYPQGKDENLRKAVRDAVMYLSRDTRAVLEDGVSIEMIQPNNMNVEAHEKLIRYFDEKIQVVCLGQTLSSGTDGGGSYALGNVHNQVRMDILEADCSAIETTLVEQLFKVIVYMNFGERALVPDVHFQIEKPQDLVGLATVLEKLVPLGLQVDLEEVSEKLGLEIPKAGAKVLKSQFAAPNSPATLVEQSMNTQGCPIHTNAVNGARMTRDGIDEMAEEIYFDDAWEKIENKMSKIATAATNIDQLKKEVTKASEDIDVSDIASKIALARVKALFVGSKGGRY